ncbi:hypothetical protein P8452_50404 [Trifolium repens]|nr:hypothetical protein P8452_50404 [Trifolium repens]
MREKVEREGESVGLRKGHRRGYIHNVDQSSISFFVTNLPDECTMAELWKVFGRFGRLGDVYIPKKVDKWGRRFAFVKFREEKDEEELSRRLEDVWLGSFKLKVNRSRFSRRVEAKETEKPNREEVSMEGEGSRPVTTSFKAALLGNTPFQEETETRRKDGGAGSVCLEVEVDGNILKELEESFVGKLAVNVEISSIRTILFMEGFAHISVTDMGRRMVLIHSPKIGEVERLWKTKVDWISYYFREVSPWTPSCFADRRETWVKVFGVPLHVWGETLFKAIGGVYGEFLDFDNNTAARSKLDVACLKIATDFRGKIDENVCIKALGVIYSLRVVEEKVFEEGFLHGERFDDHQNSWVESVREVQQAKDDFQGGGVKGGREVDGGVVPVKKCQLHGNSIFNDGDVSGDVGGKGQNQPFEVAGMLGDQSGKLIGKDNKGENIREEDFVAGGPESEQLVEGGRGEKIDKEVHRVMATCPTGEGADFVSGPDSFCVAFKEGLTRPFLSEPELGAKLTRSTSLPPNRDFGSSSKVGRFAKDGSDYSDSISLIEFRGGAINDTGKESITEQATQNNGAPRRGRPRKIKDKAKQSITATMGIPKFMKLGEALKDGGGKQRKKKKGAEQGFSSAKQATEGGGSRVSLTDEGSSCNVIHQSEEGPILEVVLPSVQITPRSGFSLLQQGEDGARNSLQRVVDSEALKLLHIQQSVGFVYKAADEEVVQILAQEDHKDKTKKQEWEQNHVSQ